MGEPVPASATDLQIAGVTPLSTVDWPGKLAAALFLQGCPWACPYCHNFEILDPLRPGEVAWSEVTDLLARRKGLLDGVVFSGGEATRQPALLPAMREVQELGFQAGLHTAGAYPQRFAQLLDAGVVDWVGFDVKALPRDYQEVAGTAAAASKVDQALAALLDSGVPYEVRLTLWRGGLDYAEAVADWCRRRGVQHFALQRLRTEHLPAAFCAQPGPEHWDGAEAAERLGQMGFASLAIRD